MFHLETVTGEGNAKVKVLYTMQHHGFPVLHAVMLGTADIFDALTSFQVEALTGECIAADERAAEIESANLAVDLYTEGL